MIEIFTGKPGSGKTLKLADTIVGLLARNEKWRKKGNPIRKVVTNIRINESLSKHYEEYLQYWAEPEELLPLRDVDIIWDEIATHLDSTQWQNVPLDVKRFLQQHRKRGIDIYGTTQSFGMVDISMRRLVDRLHLCYKLLGSRSPAPTRPPVRVVWGLVWIIGVDPETFDEEKPKKESTDWVWITRKLVDVYDTLQEIPMGKYPPMKHIKRTCIDAGCDYERIIHA